MKTSFCHIYGQLDQTGDRIVEELEHLFGLDLICDTTYGFAQGAKNSESLLRLKERGGLIAPSLYPRTLDPECIDSNWWKYSEEECIRLLEIAKARHSALGFGDLKGVTTYTPGNAFVSACRKLGIETILGFCAPTVIEDGGWEISHYGSPLSPYFISDEDFRKPEAGSRSDAVMMVSMELRNPMVCLNHWSEGPWCPLNALAADRWLEPTGRPLPFIQIAEDWLRQAELSGEGKFFHINLQYFFAGRCYEHNRRALEWLVAQREAGRLKIGGIADWKKELQSQGGFSRQTTYWRGEMMGFHVGHRPGCFPDVIVDEDLSAQRVWMAPDALPQRYYDYQPEWSYHPFKPKGGAPESTDFSEIRVNHTITSGDSLRRSIDVRIVNSGSKRIVPVVLWDVLEGMSAPFKISVLSPEWKGRAVPHPAGGGGALVLEGRASAGETHFSVEVFAGAEADGVYHRQWGNLVAAQTFFEGARPYTVLAAQTPEPFSVKVSSASDPLEHETLCGLHYKQGRLSSGETIAFDGRRLACWHRLWDVTAGEIEISGVAEEESRLKEAFSKKVMEIGFVEEIPAPGYQLFGNIRDDRRWDRVVGRLAGLKEKAAINAWFQEQRPNAGRVVMEVHPGIYIPRGSITKVLGHEFDDCWTAEGYGFEELCADYPQGWDWGVGAWVQWRMLRVRLNGLRTDRRYTLHLHAFDPENREITQKVVFYNLHDESPLDSGEGRAPWVLPKGLDGRWSPEALTSFQIKPEIVALQDVGVHIVPEGSRKPFDWIAEQAAPGMLFHLWLTEDC